MSIYRQLWLAIIVSTLLALLGSLLASTLSAREYLGEQLSLKNADNASALALSLSQQPQLDDVTVELAVAALFDSGHYELIKVVNPKGNTIVERKGEHELHNVPRWFIKRLPIKSHPGQAQISSGWKQYGTVTLVSHSRFAYRSLWHSVVEMIGALAIAGVVGGYLGTLGLRRLRPPLDAVIDQAEAIRERRFITIDEPKVPELRKLASAMNTTVVRLKTMFAEETARLEIVRHKANFDLLTGLANRNFFMARLGESMEGEDANGGALLLVRIADLEGINRKLGRAATDDLLKRAAAAIGAIAEKHHPSLAARLNGADFAVLLTGDDNARATAELMLQRLVQETEPFVTEGPCAYIGLASFSRDMKMGNLLAQVDTALAGAEAEGVNGLIEASFTVDTDQPRNAEEWKRIIANALEQGWVHLGSFPVMAIDGRLLHRDCPLRLRFDADGSWQPAGRFLPMAERFRLMPHMDLAALAKGLEELQSNPLLPGIAINLSASSMEDEEFPRQLIALLEKHAAVVSRLWLEIAENGVFKHLDAFRTLCRKLQRYDCRIGIDHFGLQFSKVGQLYDLGLDYIKVDASFIRDLDTNPGNQAFLKGLSTIAHGIGLQVIAEGVVSEAEQLALSGIGFDGVTGPAVKDPAK